jgi:DNA-binding IclR family transcriptional regulator
MCDEDTSRFRIGLKTIALAHGALRELGFRTWAEPVLYRIASETGLAAGIGVLEGGQVLVVDRVEAPEFSGQQRLIHERPRDQREIGRELPAHSTALGKVLLAYLSRNELLARLSDLELTRRTPKTIVSSADFLIELRKIRRRGYATSDEEHSHGVRAISAPIFDFTGAARAAISLNGSPNVPIWRAQRKLIALVTQAARDISRNARFLN